MLNECQQAVSSSPLVRHSCKDKGWSRVNVKQAAQDSVSRPVLPPSGLLVCLRALLFSLC